MIMVSTDMWLCVVSYKFNAVLKENLLPLSWYLIMMEAASPVKCQYTSVRLQSHISQHSSLRYNISGQNEVWDHPSRPVLEMSRQQIFMHIYHSRFQSLEICSLPLSWKSWNGSSNSSMITAGSSNGVTNTRCCRYSYLRSSWWWVEVPP